VFGKRFLPGVVDQVVLLIGIPDVVKENPPAVASHRVGVGLRSQAAEIGWAIAPTIAVDCGVFARDFLCSVLDLRLRHWTLVHQEDDFRFGRRLTAQCCREVPPLDLRCDRNAGKPANRPIEVDGGEERIGRSTLRRYARVANKKRDTRRLFEGHLLIHATVRAGHFAVVGGEDNDRVIGLPGLIQSLQQAAELPIDGANVRVVAAMEPGDRLGRMYRTMIAVAGLHVGAEPNLLVSKVRFILLRRVIDREVWRMPGDDHHPGLIGVVLVDDVDGLVGHQRSLVALGLDLRTGVRVECETVAHVLVDRTPYMPVLESLAMRSRGDEGAVVAWTGEVPLPHIGSAISRLREGVANRFKLRAELNPIAGDAVLEGPQTGHQNAAVRRTERIVRDASVHREVGLAEGLEVRRIDRVREGLSGHGLKSVLVIKT
jgi:hypothetical protein